MASILNDFDWRLIVTMHQLKNLTQTAELFYMSQPALTQRLQKIESELGVTLAVRSKKGIAFTAEGEYLAAQGTKILNLLQETNLGLASIAGKTSKVLRIGATNAFSRFFLPSILQKSKEVDSNIKFEITTDYSNKIAKMVEQAELDIGFIFGDIPFSGTKYHLGVNHAILASSNPFTLEDLPDLNRIDYCKDAFTQKLIESWWNENFTEAPNVSMTATNGDTCREMVLNGLGYAIFTIQEFVAEDTRLYKIPMTNKDGSPFIRNMWMIYKTDYSKNQILSSFINIVKQYKQ
jgi:DNA-binding transcriptional LysR family regulator